MSNQDGMNEVINCVLKVYSAIFIQWKKWNEIISQGKPHAEVIKNISFVYTSCNAAKIDTTDLVKFHPKVKENILLKLEKEIIDVQKKLLALVDELETVQNKVSNLCLKSFKCYKKHATGLPIDLLIQRTELRPSVAEMLEWLSDIEQIFTNEYLTKKFFAENYNYLDYMPEQKISNLWENGKKFTNSLHDIYASLQTEDTSLTDLYS